VIGAIKEALRGQLTSVASKLLSSEHTKLEDLAAYPKINLCDCPFCCISMADVEKECVSA
jgi:hypothetical protein